MGQCLVALIALIFAISKMPSSQDRIGSVYDDTRISPGLDEHFDAAQAWAGAHEAKTGAAVGATMY